MSFFHFHPIEIIQTIEKLKKDDKNKIGKVAHGQQ